LAALGGLAHPLFSGLDIRQRSAPATRINKASREARGIVP
jgi:hypothetical protein